MWFSAGGMVGLSALKGLLQPTGFDDLCVKRRKGVASEQKSGLCNAGESC